MNRISLFCSRISSQEKSISLVYILRFILQFCFEGMEECGSEGLEELLISVKDTFLSDVDYVCISDNYWLGTKKPCLTYGLRGICYFNIKITCAKMDLHSGLFGGTV